MTYTTNPHMPRVRMEAVKLVRNGWSIRKVARYTGFMPGTISKWCRKAPDDGRKTIPTLSSRPLSHPKALSKEVVEKIVEVRLKNRRCAEVVHYELRKEFGIVVSLSSVRRTLKRTKLIRERKWKRVHKYLPRPEVVNPGDLVELDTIHLLKPTGKRFYVYTLIDVHSRWVYAKVTNRISAKQSVVFLREAQNKAPFQFKLIQSDHGPEFSQWFTKHANITHRHSRVRKPNDNAHIERFNRTLQEECLFRVRLKPKLCQLALNRYLPYYNTERPHLALGMLSPLKCFQAIG
jgi:transposase InsO family protein